MVLAEDMSKLRILVADDEPAILEEYAKILAPQSQSSHGNPKLAVLENQLFNTKNARAPEPDYDLALCRQGDEAIEAVRTSLAADQPFSLAILDMRMPPGIDGLTAAEEIRALDPDVNIVFLTGYSDTPPDEISRRLQPNDKLIYCQKPVQAMELEQLAHALTTKWVAERGLEDAKEAAIEASRAKSEFLANMSHELRTPLNAIIGFAELMENQVLGPLGHDQYLNYTRDIRASGAHLLGVINDILDITKIEAGKFGLRESKIVIADMLEQTLRRMELQVRSAGVAVRMEVPRDLPLLLADVRAVEKILFNLLSNAIKFSPKGSEVTAAASCNPEGTLTITIEDQGIGMTDEEIHKALVYFGQVDSALSRKYEGLGLGLTLAMAMAEHHGANLDIESEPGVGTKVTVTFPAERIQPSMA